MDHTKMPMSEVLTPDEKLVADFIKTRTKKWTISRGFQKSRMLIYQNGQRVLPIWQELTAEIPMKLSSGSNTISERA